MNIYVRINDAEGDRVNVMFALDEKFTKNAKIMNVKKSVFGQKFMEYYEKYKESKNE